jgi:succinate dehydrogenase / fumarate reductase cytochrome b subunit
MSSTVPTKRQNPTNSLPSGQGLFAWIKPVFTSTVGMKFLVAVTGWGLTGFVIAHMLGNLKIFLGPNAINTYAKELQDLGALLWVARISLLVIFVVHIGLALKLKMHSVAARPVGYAHPATVQASFASLTMVYSGLLILAFVVFHIAHFTFGYFQTDPSGTSLLALHDAEGRHDVYRMVIIGFRNPIIAILYILAQLALMLHLSHGVASTFQSLGLDTPRLASTWRVLGWIVTIVVGGGNIAIVVAVWAGLLP